MKSDVEERGCIDLCFQLIINLLALLVKIEPLTRERRHLPPLVCSIFNPFLTTQFGIRAHEVGAD